MASVFRNRLSNLGRRGLFKRKYAHVADEHKYNESSHQKPSPPVPKIQTCLSFPFIQPKSPNLSRLSNMLNLRQSDDDLPLKFVTKRLYRDRAIFIALRLQQNFCNIFYGLEFHDLPSCMQDMDALSHTLTRLLACRIYTLDYLSKAHPPTPSITSYLAQIRSEVQSSQYGALEAHFAVYWVLEEVFGHNTFSESQKNLIVERARDSVITACLKSEEWLSAPERAGMYVTQMCVTDVEWEGVEVELVGVPMEIVESDF